MKFVVDHSVLYLHFIFITNDVDLLNIVALFVSELPFGWEQKVNDEGQVFYVEYVQQLTGIGTPVAVFPLFILRWYINTNFH